MDTERRRFLLLAANGGVTKLGEQLADPGLVLALLLSVLHAPLVMVGALQPVWNGAALLPQVATAGWIRRLAVRKWLWAGAATVQALALVAMPAAALTSGVAAGAIVLLLLAIYSAASGTGSVVFSDVVGRAVGTGSRGRVLGVRSAAGGALVIAAGLVLGARLTGSGDERTLLALVAFAGLLWLLGAVLFAFLPEAPAEPQGEPARGEAGRALALVRDNPGLQRFVLARCLLLAAELAMPFYALEAQRVSGGTAALGLLIFAVGLAQLLGSPLFGRLADRRSSRLVMVLGGLLGVAAALVALAAGNVHAGLAGPIFIGVFLLSSAARSAARVGRKTYVVDAAPENERALYSAASNTLAGAVSLAFIGLGVVGQLAGVRPVIGLLAGLSGAGLLAVAWMPARRMYREPRAQRQPA